MATVLQKEHRLSERRACAAVGIKRSVYRYQKQAKKDGEIVAKLVALVTRHSELGFDKLFDMIRRAGHRWNHKRVHRVYCELKLNKRRKHKRRLPPRMPQPLATPEFLNVCWSADFMSDSLWDGPRYRTFNVIDDFNREVLAIEVDLSLPAERVVRVLDRIGEVRGYPDSLRLDNGPEFVGIALARWAEKNGVHLEFIKPGRPMQNGFIERFNRTYREAVLDRYLFQRLDEVREQTAIWMKKYNEERPHQALGNKTPQEVKLNQILEVSSYRW